MQVSPFSIAEPELHPIWFEFASQLDWQVARMTSAWNRGGLQPQALQARSETMKRPSVTYVCEGFWAVDMLPSPKSHCHDVGLPVDVSVKAFRSTPKNVRIVLSKELRKKVSQVKDLDTGRIAITAQNHGFAVDVATLPKNARVTHISLFDGTLQGFELTDKPAFCFQGHPEASPGPHDVDYLFDRFVVMIKKKKN